MEAKRVTVLTLIREKKEVLFGKHSPNLTNEMKISAWREVMELAQSLDIIPIEKEWTYVRDTTWQNWRRATVVKI